MVSVDLATQSLLWGCRYGRKKANPNFARPRAGRRAKALVGDDNFNASRAMRWFDATATIADGRVVITPVEADSLYCLNLADGTLAWDPLLQRDELYVANIYRGKIILVGLHGVRAIRLDDGSPAWEGRVVDFPAGAVPSGRGYASGNRYYVPLNSGKSWRSIWTKVRLLKCPSRGTGSF